MGLGARLALVFATVAAATAVLVGGASYVTTDRQISADIDQFLVERATEIKGGQRDQPRDRRNDRDDLPTPASSPDSEVQILDRNGNIDSSSGLILPVDDIDLDLADDNGRAVLRTITIDGADYRIITDHLDGGGAVQVARSLDESASLLNVLQTRLLVIAGAMALLAAGVGWIVAQRTTRPLRALTGAIDEVAQTQDFSVPVPDAGSDEVGRLARGFNGMLGALQTSKQQQQRLVQDAAHELRTPLTSITANVDWLMRAPDLGDEARGETLAGVKRELSELNEVIAEIIELATDSRQAPELVATDLTATVEGAVEHFRQRTGRTVTLAATPAMVLGDADALSRAVANVLSNADKYSPADTPIDVRVGPKGFFVSDAGPGIPAHERALVFDRFYRRDEDRSKPGSGLGLSIVAGIVERHGGSISVSDSPLGGVTIGFELPTM